VNFGRKAEVPNFSSVSQSQRREKENPHTPHTEKRGNDRTTTRKYQRDQLSHTTQLIHQSWEPLHRLYPTETIADIEGDHLMKGPSWPDPITTPRLQNRHNRSTRWSTVPFPPPPLSYASFPPLSQYFEAALDSVANKFRQVGRPYDFFPLPQSKEHHSIPLVALHDSNSPECGLLPLKPTEWNSVRSLITLGFTWKTHFPPLQQPVGSSSCRSCWNVSSLDPTQDY